MHKQLAFFILTLISLQLSACGVTLYSLTEPTVTPTIWLRTNTPAPTATPTVNWFPSTSTPRPLRTPTPISTIEPRPQVGKAVIEDVFSEEKNLWDEFRDTSGNAVISNQALTLAIHETANTIISYSKMPALESYYVEMTIKLPLCEAGENAYGVVFRFADPNHYDQLWLNCLGQMRIEQHLKGKSTPLLDWKPTGRIRPGAPQQLKLGIWTKGNVSRIFLQDQFFVEIKEDQLTPGIIGLSAHSAGISPITVSFSDLTIYLLK